MKPLPARELSEDDCQKLIEFANVYGRSVRQRSVRQETTMAKAGTLPSSCYETNLPLQRVMLRRDETHDNSDAPLQHAAPSTEDIDAEGQDQDSDIEYDSDEPQLASEALFITGRRSRFRRTIRFHGRFIQ